MRPAAFSLAADPAQRRHASVRYPSAGAAPGSASTIRLAKVLFVAMVVGSLLCWGPIPIACLWLSAQANYLTGSVSFGVLIALVALFALLFGMLMLLRRLDNAWILVRRAAGHDQRSGALGRIFGVTAAVCAAAFSFWFVVIHGPGSSTTPGNAP